MVGGLLSYNARSSAKPTIPNIEEQIETAHQIV